MRLLTTFLPPTSGTATVCGFDICKQADQVRKSIGYLPETPPLYPELRVEEYLRFVSLIKGISPKHVQEAVDGIIQKCALTEVRTRLCGQLSRGYRQRVGLAQALVHNPPVLILDEPTSGLDPSQIIEIRRLISDLRTQHTVILSTHILPEVTQICSRVIIIANGRIAAEGAIGELTKEKSLEERFIEIVSQDQGTGENTTV